MRNKRNTRKLTHKNIKCSLSIDKIRLQITQTQKWTWHSRYAINNSLSFTRLLSIFSVLLFLHCQCQIRRLADSQWRKRNFFSSFHVCHTQKVNYYFEMRAWNRSVLLWIWCSFVDDFFCTVQNENNIIFFCCYFIWPAIGRSVYFFVVVVVVIHVMVNASVDANKHAHNLIKIKVKHAKWDVFQNKISYISSYRRKKNRSFQNAENVLNPEMGFEANGERERVSWATTTAKRLHCDSGVHYPIWFLLFSM